MLIKYWTRAFRYLFATGIACFAMLPAWGQLTSFNADGKVPTEYLNPLRDTIFVFNQVPATKMGSLSIRDYDPANTYEWYRFNDVATTFESMPFASGEYMDNLSQGGYMVKVNAEDPGFVAWVYLNSGPDFQLKLEKNDAGAVYEIGRRFCSHTDFYIDSNHPVKLPSGYTYYHPVNGKPYTMTNEVSFTVKTDKNEKQEVRLLYYGSPQYFRIYEPPYENTRYFFTGQDRFGVTRADLSDDILYETIIPHAKLSATLPSEKPNSAPVDVRFRNESVNATEYVWRFGDGDSVSFDLEHLHPDTVRHTYTLPKEYTATLFTTSVYGCTHSATIKIKVDPSKLDVGNVFSPNGDGINDFFKPENTSIRKFEISIYTRSGKRVYQQKGGDLRYWQGWDGRIDGGKDAAEGIYYYVLRAIGWDNIDYGWKDKKANNETYRSYVYLYR